MSEVFHYRNKKVINEQSGMELAHATMSSPPATG
jgi:hypothetical protein